MIDEGFSGLWRTARADPRLADLQGPIGERAMCVAGLAVQAQSDRADAARATRPDRVQGAWFNKGETRMDDQQHTFDCTAADGRDRRGVALLGPR